MALGKIIKTNGNYEFVELDDSELGNAIADAVAKNIGLFFNIQEKVNRYLQKQGCKFLRDDDFQIAIAVFNAVALKGFTALDTALAKKINEIKENGSK